MGIRVSLGGENLPIKVGGNFAWAMSYGLSPNVTDLEVTKESAERIRSRAVTTFPTKIRTRTRADPVGPLQLVMEDTDNDRRVVIEGIYVVISNRPGTDYNTRVLTLSDRRWMWSRIMVERSYNIRKKTGEFRMIRGKLQPVQLGRLRPDFAYRRATLKTPGSIGSTGSQIRGVPWTALEVLEDVLLELCGKDGYVIDANLALTDSIEGLELHDLGPEALSRVLAFIPGARVYIGADGKCHVASIYDGSEKEVFDNFGAGNAGDYSLVDRSQLRPQSFTVYSDREVELRFDFVEERLPTDDVPAAGQGSTVVRNQIAGVEQIPGREPLWCENVIINPLYYLPLDLSGSRVAVQGEPVPLDQFIDAVNLLNNVSSQGSGDVFGTRGWRPFFPSFRLTKREIRQHWLGNWTAFREKFARDDAQLYNPERLKLLAALRTHYRQTFRILPQWRDKIRTLTGNRAAVMDFETGTRAPAPVYTQFLTKFSQLGYNPSARGQMVVRNDDYAEDIGEKNVSPFEVQILDSDMGLFRVAPKVDQTGVAETYVIGDTEGGKLPTADVANAAVYWHQVHLDRGFKLATIFSCTQDTPNNEKRLHAEEVSLQEVATLLKLPAIPEAHGPPQEVIQTADNARYAWKDKDKAGIRAAFFDGDPYPQGLLTNPGDIRALSVAACAQELVRNLDRIEGKVTGPIRPVEPTGNLRSVVHFVTVGRGNSTALYTTISAPGDAPPPQVYSLLPEGVRRKVRRLVQ